MPLNSSPSGIITLTRSPGDRGKAKLGVVQLKIMSMALKIICLNIDPENI
jgi:hypothetical protein